MYRVGIMRLWILVVGILAVAGIVATAQHIESVQQSIGGQGGLLGSAGKPKIWWHVDDSQTNTREWLDWGARETTEPNEPYLRVCLRRARELWGAAYDIIPVLGRDTAVEIIRSGGIDIPSGWGEVPPALWMAWCRAAVLSAQGGLWVDGSILPVGPLPELKSSAVIFGYDPAESRAAGAAAGGVSAGWAATSGHPVWRGMARDVGAIISAGAPSWSSAEARRALRSLWDRHCSGGAVTVMREPECSRDIYGRRLELDTLLGSTDWPDGQTDNCSWVPLPDGRDSLERTVPFQWFLRLSEEQIRESQFCWAKWATRR